MDKHTHRCKICGETIEHLAVLEHAVLKHNDKEAAEVLEELNRHRLT